MQKAIILILLSLVFLQAKDTYLTIYNNNNKYSYKVSLANFGFFKYGHKLTGRLHIGAKYTNWGEDVDKDRIPLKPNTTESKEQTPITYDIFGKTNATDNTGCKHYQQFNEQYIQEYGQPIYIVDRGNCTFVRKASLAAKTGKMLIIVDNSDQEDVNEIVMGDDLSGEKVMMPVVMVSKKDGAEIKELIQNELKQTTTDEDKQIWISITFNKPYEKERSEIQYWMIPSEKESYVFLKNHTYFLTYLYESNKAVLEPHFVLFRCDDTCKKGYEGKQDVIQNSCILDGKYCHPDPDDKGPLTGVDSLNQAITEMCIQKHFPEYFLSYFTGFHECYIKQSKRFVECGKIAFQQIAKDHPSAAVESFEFRMNECAKKERIEPNLLEKEYRLFVDQGLKFYPALFVNGDIYRGDLLLQEAAEEFICESIEDTKDVEVCAPYSDIKDDVDKFGNRFLPSEDSNLIFIVCGVLFLIFVIGLFIYRRKIKLEVQKELTMQVDAAIQQYYALNEGK